MIWIQVLEGGRREKGRIEQSSPRAAARRSSSYGPSTLLAVMVVVLLCWLAFLLGILRSPVLIFSRSRSSPCPLIGPAHGISTSIMTHVNCKIQTNKIAGFLILIQGFQLRHCLDVVGFASIHMYWVGLEWNLN